MWKKTSVHILYGIKIIALWCLVANLTIFGVNLHQEFKATVTVENAVLTEEYYDYYPGERAAFDADIGGRISIALSKSWQEAIFTETVVFVLFSLVLIKQGKQIRNTYPVLTCVTHVLGAVASVATLFLWMMGVDNNTWEGFGQAIMAFCSFIAYAIVMFIIWLIRTIFKNAHAG